MPKKFYGTSADDTDRDGAASADFQIKCVGTINFTANAPSAPIHT